MNIQSLIKSFNTEQDILDNALESLNKANTDGKKINAFITTLSDEDVIKQVKNLKNIDKSAPLYGVPYSLKDIVLTKGIRTTGSSRILENFIPTYSATIYKKIQEAGGILIGKNNCDAFAFGASNENSGYGAVRNPLAMEKVPGGSSGGSAASVAAGINLFSIGSDTGGSVRQPAALTGIYGLKATYGLNSRYGFMAMASSLDTPGVVANNIEDIELVQKVIEGVDIYDATTRARPINHKVPTMRIGIPKEYFANLNDLDIKNAVMDYAKSFEKKGYELVDISLPHTEYAIATYYIIVPSEISSNMGRYDGIRFGKDRSHFEEEVKRRIMIGSYTLSSGYYDAYYKKAMQVRTLIRQDFKSAFENVDFIITPVSPTVAWDIGEKADDPVSMYLSDIYTVTANLAGIPALSAPTGRYKNLESSSISTNINGDKATKLPIAAQIIGPEFSEYDILGLLK